MRQMTSFTPETISVEFTECELQDLRIAMMDYTSKWMNYHSDCILGVAPKNMSQEGARLCYEDARKLQERIIVLSKNF